MDSDEVTSINDTTESQQVAKIVRTVYYDILNRSNLPEQYTLVNVTETSSTTPTLMTLPTETSQIKWVKYDCHTATDTDVNMQLMNFLPLEDFLDRMDQLDPTGTNIASYLITVGSDTYRFYYRNDKAPQFYTTYNDYDLLFDSYDAGVDTFLRASKTRTLGKLIETFTLSDSFTPTLDEPQFALLLNEAKSLAWAELKQSPHQKAEQAAKRAWSGLRKTKYGIKTTIDFDELPYFGRK